MKKLLAASVFVAIAALTACAGPHREYVAGGEYDGYYDGYYGPYVGGYWNGDGFFYYSDGHDGYRRDDARHYRHERFENGTPFHSYRERE